MGEAKSTCNSAKPDCTPGRLLLIPVTLSQRVSLALYLSPETSEGAIEDYLRHGAAVPSKMLVLFGVSANTLCRCRILPSRS
jgi:hypothetical protein